MSLSRLPARRISSLAALVVSAGLAIASSDLAAQADLKADQPPVSPARTLDLRVGKIDTTTRTSLLAQPAPVNTESTYVMQLDGPLTPQRETTLKSHGVALGQYLPTHAYLVKLHNADVAKLAELGFVVWLGEYDAAWKLDPEINSRAYLTPHRQALASRGMAEITVLCFDGADTRPAINEITRLGGEVRSANPEGDQWALDATLNVASIPALARLSTVQFIEDGPEVTPRNDTNRWILQSNIVNQTPVWNKGIHGEGQVGGLIDGTIAESHCMFDDTVAVGPTHRKIVAMRSAGASDVHGTHTAGTFAGDAAPFGVYTTNDGMAFAAKLSFTNLSAIASSGTSLSLRFQDAHNDGARVHSNSWGDDSTTSYTNWCRQIDLFTAANEDSLVAFAVSNGSFATTPENSMNVLGVGASQDTPNQANHCSGGTGPTLDGRRKPEVYAPGCGTISASSSTSCGTTALTGTSMACPAVSGAGLLVRQYFAEGWYPSGTKSTPDARTPSGALIKAVLINTSTDMTGIAGYPSNREGWGRVLLDNSLFFSGDARKLYVEDVRNSAGLTTGQFLTYYVRVVSNAQPLEITLASTHPAAAVGAASPVVNDIDLEVTDPSGTLYKGNAFTSGQSSSGGVSDAKNNVERVIRTTPAVGLYTITVRGTAVNSPGVKQGFALVASGDLIGGCTTPTINTQPADLTVRIGHPANLLVAASATGTLSYQWKKATSAIPGANAASLVIASAQLTDAGSFTVDVSTPCGSVTSNPALLTVLCPADFNGDGFVTGQDFDEYVQAFEAANSAADFNEDGFVTGEDFDLFVAAFAAGC